MLNLAENLLEHWYDIHTLTELTELNLAANKLRRISPDIKNLKKLEKLDISGNPLTTLVDLNPLRNLNLKELNIAQNIYPLAQVCRIQNYQLHIFFILQTLTTLDGQEVSGRSHGLIIYYDFH